MTFDFTITARSARSRARTGIITTPHGTARTPTFIPCATRAALKGATLASAREAGVEFILANTYHLLLAPGPDLVRAMGGLHRFMRWSGPMLTDSGGFQIFSLAHGGVADEVKGRAGAEKPKSLLEIDEAGATFRSYLDGTIHRLTPESSIETQAALGPDFAVILDECTPFHATRDYTARSLARTFRWSDRSIAAFDAGGRMGSGGPQALYGIMGGGVHEDLRREAADFVNDRPFFGQAVGDSLGGDRAQMHDIVALSMRHLRSDRPTHLLGIGMPADIRHGVRQGIDTFDCVHPTRVARHGGALVNDPAAHGIEGERDHLNLRNARFKADPGPLEEGCDCEVCAGGFSRAYLHHLVRVEEPLAGQLLVIHNLRFMMRLMETIRTEIEAGLI